MLSSTLFKLFIALALAVTCATPLRSHRHDTVLTSRHSDTDANEVLDTGEPGDHDQEPISSEPILHSGNNVQNTGLGDDSPPTNPDKDKGLTREDPKREAPTKPNPEGSVSNDEEEIDEGEVGTTELMDESAQQDGYAIEYIDPTKLKTPTAKDYIDHLKDFIATHSEVGDHRPIGLKTLLVSTMKRLLHPVHKFKTLSGTEAKFAMHEIKRPGGLHDDDKYSNALAAIGIHSGGATHKHLQQLAKQIGGIELSVDDAKEVVSRFDENHSGKLDKDEFGGLVKSLHRIELAYRNAPLPWLTLIAVHDSDKNLAIDKHELANFLKTQESIDPNSDCGLIPLAKRAGKILAEHDHDDDGLLEMQNGRTLHRTISDLCDRERQLLIIEDQLARNASGHLELERAKRGLLDLGPPSNETLQMLMSGDSLELLMSATDSSKAASSVQSNTGNGFMCVAGALVGANGLLWAGSIYKYAAYWLLAATAWNQIHAAVGGEANFEIGGDLYSYDKPTRKFACNLMWGRALEFQQNVRNWLVENVGHTIAGLIEPNVVENFMGVIGALSDMANRYVGTDNTYLPGVVTLGVTASASIPFVDVSTEIGIGKALKAISDPQFAVGEEFCYGGWSVALSTDYTQAGVGLGGALTFYKNVGNVPGVASSFSASADALPFSVGAIFDGTKVPFTSDSFIGISLGFDVVSLGGGLPVSLGAGYGFCNKLIRATDGEMIGEKIVTIRNDGLLGIRASSYRTTDGLQWVSFSNLRYKHNKQWYWVLKPGMARPLRSPSTNGWLDTGEAAWDVYVRIFDKDDNAIDIGNVWGGRGNLGGTGVYNGMNLNFIVDEENDRAAASSSGLVPLQPFNSAGHPNLKFVVTRKEGKDADGNDKWVPRKMAQANDGKWRAYIDNTNYGKYLDVYTYNRGDWSYIASYSYKRIPAGSADYVYLSAYNAQIWLYTPAEYQTGFYAGKGYTYYPFKSSNAPSAPQISRMRTDRVRVQGYSDSPSPRTCSAMSSTYRSCNPYTVHQLLAGASFNKYLSITSSASLSSSAKQIRMYPFCGGNHVALAGNKAMTNLETDKWDFLAISGGALTVHASRAPSHNGASVFDTAIKEKVCFEVKKAPPLKENEIAGSATTETKMVYLKHTKSGKWLCKDGDTIVAREGTGTGDAFRYPESVIHFAQNPTDFTPITATGCA